MGKGTIASGGTNGQYQVTLNLDTTRIQARIAALTEQIASLTAKLAEMEEGQAKDLVNLQKVACEKKKAFLQDPDNVTADFNISTWCCDMTEDLSGAVGTIEVPGERSENTNVLVRPGYNGGAVYNAARDGQLQQAIAGTPASVFWNYAMLPGWQKWKPTHRFGTISAISGDTCDVTLENIASTAQGLGINQTSTLSAVPIEYMICNGAAFEVGDQVVVEFTNQAWGSPKVIGFRSSPKACEYVFFIKPTFNGFTPTLGREAIRITYTDYTETPQDVTKLVHGTDYDGLGGEPDTPNGYCGPYTIAGQDYYTDPKDITVQLMDEIREDQRYAFCGYYYVGDDVFRIQYKKMSGDAYLFDSEPSETIEIDGKDYDVYSATFTGLKIIERAYSAAYYGLIPAECSCVPESIEDATETTYTNWIGDYNDISAESGGTLIDTFESLCGDESCEVCSYSSSYSWTWATDPEEVAPEDEHYLGVICDDANYTNPTFYDWTGTLEQDLSVNAGCEGCDPPTPSFTICDTPYDGMKEYQFAMVDTPQSVF